ncbi:uncharacterized protein PFL1_00183 [Pseudozyma flocculosa PF-1]|uniref:Related to aspartic protease n=1 Tax=Pseudozyma flocculosa TaxID=84751 RepID=A0A5C3ESS8_9BASI|nr:uncharacterized protein PFL1_00183 [Pseudozyma flocculosa PF-1]EPQ31985.1 hypothetical protein PFL1_00183 [Pseudozyma flocculosa PF-1]SPO35092.1 related to aspartic protease [Pseudozyma flocculosa]
MKASSSTLLVSSLLLAAASSTLAAPVSPSDRATPPSPHSHFLRRRAPIRSDPAKLVEWSKSHRDRLQRKYGLSGRRAAKSRREATSEPLTNLEYDSTWLADIDVGTPAKTYAVVLDTGSADFWLDKGSFDPAASSSFTNSTTAFDLTYGSGDVAGYLGKDTVTLAGATGNNVVLAVADDVSSDLADSNINGIMGMGFRALSSADADPFWRQMNFDTFSFYLERRTANSKSAKGDKADGGVFTLGGTNSTLYQGDIDYVPLIEQQYWMLKLEGLSTSGESVALGTTTRAAIDTGTTLIGGPDDVVRELYAQVPGSSELAESPGYYSYPCSTPINATISFGQRQYSIPDADFSAGSLSSSGDVCMGAVFGAGSTAKDNLQWIVGDAFLKNVYTVFTTADGQARVGFAALAPGLESTPESDMVVITSAPTTSSSSSSSSSNSGVKHVLPWARSSVAMAWIAVWVAMAMSM